MKYLVATIAVIAFAASAFAQENLVGTFPEGGGAISVTATGGDVAAAGLDFNSASGSLVPAPGTDASPFTFFLSNTANQVTYGNLGTSVTFADGSTTALSVGAAGGATDITASWGKGATPVAFTVSEDIPVMTGPTFCDTSEAQVCFDFDSGAVEGATLIGDGEIRGEGGLGGTGYLKVTDAANGQRGTVILPDVGGGGQFVFGGRTGGANAAHHIDNLEASIVDGMVSISAALRVGGGTDRPADGFSFNFVRPGDPLLEGTGDGYAGVGSETNLPEEGSTTGISIGFDEWQSGPAPETGAQYVGADARDVVGMSLRIDGVIVGQAELPTLNGALEDITSLQTGPNDGSDLGWATLTINAPAEGADLSNVVVTWKGSDVNFVPEPGTGLMAMMSILCLGVMRRRRK